MSRTTQYIGLTFSARDYISLFTKKQIVITTGMFDENIFGYEYTDEKENKFTEIVQCEPWSSGPMIFTHLKNEQTGEFLFSWVVDENVMNEVDYQHGTMFV